LTSTLDIVSANGSEAVSFSPGFSGLDSCVADCFSVEQRLAFLRAHGSGCLAYATLQPGLSYFDITGVGYVAHYLFKHPIFARQGRRLVIGDPICSQETLSDVLDRFLASGPPAMFLQVSEGVAGELHRRGYRVNQLGVETEIPIQDFSLDGKAKSRLRHWRNKALKEGVKVSEAPIAEMDRGAVEAVSANWLSRKGHKELQLLIRPLCYEREPLVRYFWAHCQGKLIGMIGFDPLCRDNAVFGYYHNVVRLSKDAPHGTSDLMTLAAMETFRAEGAQTLSFGLAPLAEISAGQFRANMMLHRILLLLRKYGERLYPFAGIYEHKAAYRPVLKRVYCSGIHGNSMLELISAMKAIGVL